MNKSSCMKLSYIIRYISMNMTSGCTNENPLEVTNTKNIIFLLILWSITHKNNFKLIALSFVK